MGRKKQPLKPGPPSQPLRAQGKGGRKRRADAGRKRTQPAEAAGAAAPPAPLPCARPLCRRSRVPPPCCPVCCRCCPGCRLFAAAAL